MPSKTIPAQTSTYLEAVKQRRSVYGVTDEVIMSDDRIVEIASTVIQSCPSA
jgi:predicted oxidoreductase (fatty acid repression mutant protein)